MIPGEVNLLSFSHGWLRSPEENLDAGFGFNINAKVLSEIFFDPASLRYKWVDGNRFVSKANVTALIDRKIENKKEELKSYSERIKLKEVGVYKDVAGTLKDLHILQAAKVKGFENITDRDLGIIGNQLKKQYYAGVDPETGKQYGLKFLIKDAPESSITQIENRLRMFGESSEVTGNLIKEDGVKSEGLTESMRSLGATHDHCEDCLRYASVGWQPIGILPVPKVACQCHSNCKCSINYR